MVMVVPSSTKRQRVVRDGAYCTTAPEIDARVRLERIVVRHGLVVQWAQSPIGMGREWDSLLWCGTYRHGTALTLEAIFTVK